MRNRREGRANREQGRCERGSVWEARAYLGIEVGEGSTHPIEAQPLAELGDLHNGPREIEERVEGGSVCVEGADGSRIRVARRRHERRHSISMSNPS